MQIVSKGDNLHEMSNPVFVQNIRKIFQNIICCKFYPEGYVSCYIAPVMRASQINIFLLSPQKKQHIYVGLFMVGRSEWWKKLGCNESAIVL